jgi:hypothetical protein
VVKLKQLKHKGKQSTHKGAQRKTIEFDDFLDSLGGVLLFLHPLPSPLQVGENFSLGLLDFVH